MKSGEIVDRRDHVLMTCFLPLLFIVSTFFWRWSSMNGPFFSDRAMAAPYLVREVPKLLVPRLLAALPRRDEVLVRSLVVPRAETARHLAPRRPRRLAALRATL